MSHQPYFATYIEDLEQDPFDATDFVERLAWRIGNGPEDVDATHLMKKFEEEIGSLQLLSEQFQGKLNILDQQHNVEKQGVQDELTILHDKNAEALERLKHLDSTMQSVFTKVVHLGDQLESVHAPRARAFEALQLMQHFDEFLADQPLHSPVFTDPDRLLESAEMIQKLSSISQELARDKFANVQMRIAHKYEEIEKLLIEEFIKSHNRQKMREIALILSEFKRFSECLDAFIERVQNGAFRSGSVFDDILMLCEKTQPMIEEIFPKPQQVMGKLVLNVFHGKLQETVSAKLQEYDKDNDNYLQYLYEVYTKTVKLQSQLQKFKCDSDPNFLNVLTRSVFAPYLSDYSKRERELISQQCRGILGQYYDSKGHQKRNIQAGGFQELKRDIQARLLNVENFGGETFLSEEVAINILQETKNAFMRCSVLGGKKEEVAQVANSLFDLLLNFLYREHVDYAIELALTGISTAEPKTEPPSNFFGVVQQTAAITHLFVKQFDDSLHPLVKDSTVEDSVITRRDMTLQHVENRVNMGLERQINVLVAYVRYILNTEQKKTDFKPDSDYFTVTDSSNACRIVTRYLAKQGEKIRESVDGSNLTAVMNELGTRLYNTILQHIQSFSYNEPGGMLLLTDVKEYNQCIERWELSPATRKQFEALPALSNLLVVKPENLEQARTAPTLSDFDPLLINRFISLRLDTREKKRNLGGIFSN
uniref:Exocyst complex component 5 n=1 Tax=Panagrellus redivivus TaxID=6233 RepID=A0A7E4UZB6_PANRE